jgi:hypothetical protein
MGKVFLRRQRELLLDCLTSLCYYHGKEGHYGDTAPGSQQSNDKDLAGTSNVEKEPGRLRNFESAAYVQLARGRVCYTDVQFS